MFPTSVALPEAALSTLLMMTAQASGVPFCGLLHVTDRLTRLIAAHGKDQLGEAAVPPFLVPTPQAPVWIADVIQVPELKEAPWVSGLPGVRFYAAVRVPGQPELALFVADRQPRGAMAPAELNALLGGAGLVGALLPPAPARGSESQAARQTHAEHLGRDLAAAQATLGVYALSELELEPAELMHEAMRLVGAHGTLDWCGVVALQNERARLTGVWHVPDAAPYARALQSSFPREGHDWLWRAATQPGPMTLEHLPPSLRETPLLAPVRGLFTLPLGTHDAVPYLLVGLQLAEPRGRGHDLPLMQAVARVIRQTLERQAQAEQLATRHAELQYTLDHAPLILWRTDGQGIFQAGQGQGLQELGLSRDALVGLSALEVYRDAPEVVSSLQRGLGGEAHRVLLSVAGRDYESHLQPLWEDGVQSGLLGLSYDVTERAQAERRAGALLRISQLLEATSKLPEVAGQVLEALSGALPVDWLVLWRRDGERLRPLAVWGEPTPGVARVQRHGVPLAWVEGSGVWEGQVVSAQGERLPPPLVAAGVLSSVMLPVWTDDPARGVLLGAFCRHDQPLTPDQHELLAVAAQTLRAAVSRREQTLALRVQALCDPLTGLGNRRALEADFSEWLALAQRQGLGLGVISLDVDGFKGVNDKRGHAAGDDLLRALSQALRGTLRAEDRIYRVGGDEFIVLMIHSGLEVPPLAQRLHQALALVRATGFPDIGLSWGQATAPADGLSLATLLALSDARLYEHKREKIRGLETLS